MNFTFDLTHHHRFSGYFSVPAHMTLAKSLLPQTIALFPHQYNIPTLSVPSNYLREIRSNLKVIMFLFAVLSKHIKNTPYFESPAAMLKEMFQHMSLAYLLDLCRVSIDCGHNSAPILKLTSSPFPRLSKCITLEPGLTLQSSEKDKDNSHWPGVGRR